MNEYDESRAVADACAQALAGHDSKIQGSVLAELLVMWVCGHHPASVRPFLLDGMISMIRGGFEVYEKGLSSPESPGAVPAGSDPGQKIH